MKAITSSRTSTGALSLIGAQAVFLVSSYALHMFLARLLGPAGYGVYGVVFNLLSLLYILVNAGVPQAVSRYVAAAGRPGSIMRRALALQLASSLAIALAYAVAGVAIARVLGDTNLEPYFRLSALAIPTYALYSLLAGYLGGLRLFVVQAGSVALYGVAKMLAVCALAYVGGIDGALIGLAIGPLGPLLLALGLGRRGATRGEAGVSTRALVGFAGPFTIFAVSVEAMTMLDLFLAKALVGDAATVGYYTAASTIARVPYFLFVGLGTAVLPVAARAAASGEDARTDRLIRQALRLVILLAVPGVAFTAVMARPVVGLLYSVGYEPAAYLLPVLTAGMSLSALFRVCASVEAGEGHEKTAMGIGLLSLAVGLVGGIGLVSTYGLLGAALANLLMGAVGSAAVLLSLSRRHRRALPLLTALRSTAAAAVAAAFASLLPETTLGMLAGALAGTLVYALLLVVLREVDQDDLRALLGALPGRLAFGFRQG